jgi:hypothetical protein
MSLIFRIFGWFRPASWKKQTGALAADRAIDKPCCGAITGPREGAARRTAVKREAGETPALCPQL